MIEVVHIVARVTTDMTRFNAGMASMEAKAKTTAAKMSFAGMRMTKYLTLPIAGIAYAGVKTAVSFQKSMTLIQTQAGATAKSIPVIAKAIQGMAGRSVMQSQQDLADGFYHLQSVFGNTISVAKKLSILKSVAHLAQIGGSSMEDTTSAVAGIMRTRLKGAQSVEKVVRTINGIVGSGNMRMPQFVESTGTAVLQVARLLGMSLKQVGAAEAVFTDENMNANMSMTRLRTSLMMAVNPSDAARKKMEQLGISSLKIGETMRSKNGFGNTLDYLSKKYEDYVKSLEAKGKSAAAAKTLASGLLFGSFGGSKGASVWATLVQQHEMFHQKEGQITAKEKDFNKDLAASNKTMAVQFEKAWHQMQVALSKFGVAVFPIVISFVHVLVRVANAFTALPTPVQHFIAAAGVALAILGPMLILFGSMIQSFKLIGTMLGSEGAVGLGFGGLPLLIIGAVAALVYFAMKSKTFRAWLESWGKRLQGFFKWLGEDVVGPFFYKLYKYFQGGGKASRWNTIIIPAFKAFGHTVHVVGQAVLYMLKSIIQAFKDMADVASAVFHNSFFEKLGGIAAGLTGAGGGKGLTKRQQFLTMLDSEHGKKGYKRDLQIAYDRGYLHRPKHKKHRAGGGAVAQGQGYMVGEYGPEWFEPGTSGTISKGPKGGGNGAAPLVHIAEMHVRNESDAEIVSGMIARKVCIP